jgi:hypothetical protein
LREVCFLLAADGTVLWRELGESPTALPDSRPRWEALWALRFEVAAVVHSHPLGPHAFSDEDVSTMEALDVALGRSLTYAVLSPQGLVWRGLPLPALNWVDELAQASQMHLRSPPQKPDT